MGLFRKFFYRKPPDKLLEISERVYVFDYCFTTDVLEEAEYKVYIGGIVGQLREHLPDASFMVFNFRDGENQSQISNILSDYDMTVMDYPRHYEGCPLLTMEMIHHFLRSSESWLLLGQNNVLLMHCERGGWPVLAFILAALLIYRKQYTGEQKTLDMIYKQAPRELLQLMSSLNPMPSQLRYLQYVSRRNVGSEWPPLDRALTLDCLIIRFIPNFDEEGGCRPIFRIYGQDPFMAADRTPKVLFSTPKRTKLIRHYKQEDSELVKFDIHCHIQGDVVLECINLDDDLEREEMIFRVMFNTAFIRSNILMLNRDDIDILWNAKDRFPKDFRTEVLFSEMDAASSLIPIDLPGVEEKEGLPMEAFAKVQEIFNNVDWLDPKTDAALNVLQRIKSASVLQEKSPTLMDEGKQSMPSSKPSLDANSVRKKIEAQELLVALQRPAQSKIISQRVPQTPFSSPVSYSNSLPGSPVPMSRYHSAPSDPGITALLHDHTVSSCEEVKHAVTVSLPSPATAALYISDEPKPVQPSIVAIPPPPSPAVLPSSLQSLVDVPITKEETSATPPPLLMPTISSSIHSSPTQHPDITLQSSLPHSPLPPPALSRKSPSSVKTSFSGPPPPPPPPSVTSALLLKKPAVRSVPPPSPPPPPSVTSALLLKKPAVRSGPPPPPPTPPHSGPSSGPKSTSLAPPPPPPPFAPKDSLSKNSACVPPVPPPPAPSANGLSITGGASPQPRSGVGNGNAPPIPGPPSGAPFSAKGRSLLRTSTRNQAQPKKANLKPYHWLKLTRAVQGSLWAEAQKPDETSKAPEFDMSELESLFSTALPNSDHGSTGGKSNRRLSGPKPEKVQLMELRRAYNCEIMLSKVKIPLPDLMSYVLVLDDSALDIDQVENLIKFSPTKEEMELLKGYSGDKANLGKCEQFFLELMKVPRVESKLRVFSFKIQFHSQVSDLRKNLNVVNSASEEIRNSVKLKRIMQTILSLGNALNHGTARGSAIGFRLDSLLKLTDTRARNNKMTLMHYLCKVLSEKLSELLDFPKDLVSLEASTKIQLKYLAEEMQAISKGLEKVVQELTASENDGPISEYFCKSLKEFLSHAEAEVRSLASLYSSVGRNADALALYFGEDPARCPFEQVVSTLLNFVRMFVRAHAENCKQIEFEKKKAQRDAENEQRLFGTPKKGSPHST